MRSLFDRKLSGIAYPCRAHSQLHTVQRCDQPGSGPALGAYLDPDLVRVTRGELPFFAAVCLLPSQRLSSSRALKSLFECAFKDLRQLRSMALSLEQALACKTGRPLLARSLWARFRQPRRQGFLGQAIEIPHSNRLLDRWCFFGTGGPGAWVLTVSAISSPNRAATSPSSSTFAAAWRRC